MPGGSFLRKQPVIRFFIVQKKTWGFSYHSEVLKLGFRAHPAHFRIIIINVTHRFRTVCSFSKTQAFCDLQSLLNFQIGEEDMGKKEGGGSLSPAVSNP